jgi:putative DNA primase/helicase
VKRALPNPEIILEHVKLRGVEGTVALLEDERTTDGLKHNDLLDYVSHVIRMAQPVQTTAAVVEEDGLEDLLGPAEARTAPSERLEPNRAFDDYSAYLKSQFRGGDVICFAAINQSTNKTDHQFVTYETALTLNYYNLLLRVNEHASIYVAMNSFPQNLLGAHVGRTADNVLYIRSLQADADDVTKAEATLLAMKADGLVPVPSLVVESSPNKRQTIWSVTGIGKDEAKQLNTAIAQKYGTDPAVVDVARVMRIPGFRNRKYAEAPLVVLLENNGGEYSRADFKIVDAPAATKPAMSDDDFERNEHGMVVHGEIHRFMLHWAGKWREAGLEHEQIDLLLMQKVHAECAKTIDDSKVHAMAESICRLYPAGTPTHKIAMSSKTQAALAQLEPQEFAWPEPQPLGQPLLPVPEFKPEFLPKSLRDYAVDVAERMGVPLDFTGICALTSLIGITGRRMFVHPKEHDKDWSESICLSGLVVSSSGTKKTPTWKAMMAPIISTDLVLRQQYSETLARYNELVKKREKDKNITVPPKPVKNFLVLNDATPEAMHEAMSENPSGYLFYRDELSSWVEEFEKPGREGQRQMFLQAMNGNDVYNLDRIGRGSISAVMCLSIFGSFQPDLMRDFLGNNRNLEDGMIPRFSLGVWPDPLNSSGVDRSINAEAKLNYQKIVAAIAMIEAKFIRAHFDYEAQCRFDDWKGDILGCAELVESKGLQSHLRKFTGALPRVAALFQLIDLIDSMSGAESNSQSDLATVSGWNGKNTGLVVVDGSHVRMAIALFDYLVEHAYRIYNSAWNPTVKAARAIALRIKDGQFADRMNARAVYRKCWSGLRGVNADQITMALEFLEEMGWLRSEERPVPYNKPVVVWYVNPKARMAGSR